MEHKYKRIGFSLVEVIVAVGVFSLLVAGVLNVVTSSYNNYYGSGDKQNVTEFTQEAVEILKTIRDNSWQDIEDVAGSGNQGLIQNAEGYWEFSGSENTLGDLTRTVGVYDVYRDSSGNVVESGGTIDPNTYRVVATTSGTGIDDYVVDTYVTNWAYKSWEQSDWSGTSDREFWSELDMASSSVSNINTSTSGEISLSQPDPPGAIFSDLTAFATTTQYDVVAWRPFNGYIFSPDGDTLYTFGNTNTDIKAFDITHIREDIFDTLLWENSMADYVGAMTISSNGRYLYAANYYLNGAETSTMPFVWVLDTTDGSIVDSELCDDEMGTANLRGMDITLNSDESELYIISSWGGFYSYDVSSDGASITPERSGGGGQDSMIARGWQEWGYSPQRMYLDESGATPYIYVVSDDSYWSMAKWDISSTTEPSFEYFYDGSGDCNDLEFLGDNGSGNEFVILCDDTEELKTIRDTGSALSVIDTADPGTFTYGELEYDGDGEVVLLSKTAGNLAAWDVSDISNLTEDVAEDSTTIELTYNTWPQHFLAYSELKGGYFFQDWGQGAVEDGIGWMPRPETRNVGTGYDYKRTITIDSGGTKVVSGPHTNFPFLFSEIQSYLKSSDNGGKVKNNNGYDIIFTSDSSGTTILDHEIEEYNSSTGEFIAWVEIPSLTTDTDIYMFYGNNNVSTTQERITSVWDSTEYLNVNHMYQRHELLNQQQDSTFQYYVDNYGDATQATGKIGYGYTYDGDTDYSNYYSATPFGKFTDEMTYSMWVRIDGESASNLNGLGGVISTCRFYANEADPAYFRTQCWDSAAGQHNLDYTYSVFNWEEWTKIDFVFERPISTLYRNGEYFSEYATDFDLYDDPYVYIYSGSIQSNMYWMNGMIDEVRIGNVAKSAGWIETTYNNENSTSTFYSVGSEALANGYSSPGTMYSSIFDLRSTDKELRSVVVEQNIPSECDIDVDIEASDDITFTSGNVTTETFSDSASYYISSTPATLNGKDFIRYKTTLTSCGGGAYTPTLYSVKLNYR